MAYSPGLALHILESVDPGDVSARDLCSWLQDACCDLADSMSDGGYCYCCYCDHIGDGESGFVIYSCNGDLMKAPYQIAMIGGKQDVTIDTSKAVDVVVVTSYVPEAAEAMEARRKLKEKGARHSASDMSAIQAIHDHAIDLGADCKTDAEEAKKGVRGFRFSERNISQGERDSADDSSFAGKNRSFPILKKSDVKAAASSLGRAGSDNYSTDRIKANIIRIAKRKGWASSLPKAWQDDAKESHVPGEQVGDLALTEGGFEFLEPIELREGARTDYEVKLIAPGKGSSAFYPAEVLKRDGPSVFKSGTHMYWNHMTESEEAQRPEGNLDHLAAVLTSNAYYKEGGQNGDGLYARAKVFSDYADKIAERAPHIGLSIRAAGNRDGNKLVEGVPVLREFTYADSVDWVTKAGAGGLVCMESARPAEVKESAATTEVEPVTTKVEESNMAMTEQEQQELREARMTAQNLKERFLIIDAAKAVQSYLSTVPRISEAIKERVGQSVLVEGRIPKTAAGDCDAAEVKKLAEAQLKAELDFIKSATGGRVVYDMGGPSGEVPKENKKRVKEAAKEQKKFMKESAERFGFMGKDYKMGRKILNEGRSAFNPAYNARVHGRLATHGQSLPGLEG